MPGIEPGLYPPRGHVLPVYYTPYYNCSIAIPSKSHGFMEKQPQPKHNNGRRHSNATKLSARKMRGQGFTHREIAKELGISVGSAFIWTTNIHLSVEQQEEIKRRQKSKTVHWSKQDRIKIGKRLRQYQFKKKHTRSSLIKEIRDFFKVHGRIPLKREFNSRRIFRSYFGTWNNAIREAGFDPNPELFAKRVVAIDGDLCDSCAEQIIDNWLSSHNIIHRIHYPYEHSKMTADFFLPVSNTYIEYFGLYNVIRRYNQNMQNKLHYIRQRKINLIPLYPKDLNQGVLDQKLGVII